MTTQIDWPRYTRWTWIIALWALAALVGMWALGIGSKSDNCCGKPIDVVPAKVTSVAAVPVVEIETTKAPVSVTAPTMANMPMMVQSVNAFWADGKITLNGVVATKGTKKAMLAAAATKYGEANVIDKLTVDRSVKITLKGEVDSDAIKAKRGTEAQAFYPGTTVDNQLMVKLKAVTDVATPTVTSKINAEPEPPIASSKVNTDAVPPTTVSKATVVVRSTDASKVQCGDNIVIAANFAKGSGRLSPEMAEVLEAVVPCIKGRYEIGGHTDNIGEDDKNQVLSQRRAKTVANFLIEKGVNAKSLKVKGYGESAPIGDNLTEAGRIKNRRIEFKKM